MDDEFGLYMLMGLRGSLSSFMYTCVAVFIMVLFFSLAIFFGFRACSCEY